VSSSVGLLPSHDHCLDEADDLTMASFPIADVTGLEASQLPGRVGPEVGEAPVDVEEGAAEAAGLLPQLALDARTQAREEGT